MNREILFRGKQVDNGEWVKGSLILKTIWNSTFYVIRCFDYGFDNYNEYEVVQDTIGQYTGLTDKNGNKIFEGDIVDCSKEWWNDAVPAGYNSLTLEVKWDARYSGYDPFVEYNCNCGVYINAENIEIIGNIYE